MQITWCRTGRFRTFTVVTKFKLQFLDFWPRFAGDTRLSSVNQNKSLMGSRRDVRTLDSEVPYSFS